MEAKKKFDKTVAVVADPALCLQRYSQATGYDSEAFEARAAQQWPLLEKATQADYVIMNNGSFDHLQQITKELYLELTEERI